MFVLDKRSQPDQGNRPEVDPGEMSERFVVSRQYTTFFHSSAHQLYLYSGKWFRNRARYLRWLDP